MKKLDKKKIASHLLAIFLAVIGGFSGYYLYTAIPAIRKRLKYPSFQF